jgi:hypothetical protein
VTPPRPRTTRRLEEAEKGMQEMAEKFRAGGGEIEVKV